MTKLDQLAALLVKAPDEVFIQPHNVPDPDAIAASFGLQHLLKEREIKTVIVYENEVEKANSLKMLELFGIEMEPASQVVTMGEEDGVHGFTDLRPEVGACSSIMAEYYVENNIDIPRRVATALLYGIFMDTSDLTRGVSELDINMFYHLYGHSDISLITELKGNQISKTDLDDYARAFQTVEIYDQMGFLCPENCNDSLLGAAGDSVLSMAGGFLPHENIEEGKSIHTFVRHRAIAFLEDQL